MIRLRGYELMLLNIRFMQLFTQPSIADTWVVTRSSLSSGSQVLVFTAHYRSLCYCNAEF